MGGHIKYRTHQQLVGDPSGTLELIEYIKYSNLLPRQNPNDSATGGIAKGPYFR